MAYEASMPLQHSFVAGGDLSAKQFHFVKLNSSGQVVICAAATDEPIGVLQNNPASGGIALVTIIGITKLVADAALATPGTIIGTSADGQADAKAWGTDKTEYGVGKTLTAGTGAGSVITAVVQCVLPSKLNLTA